MDFVEEKKKLSEEKDTNTYETLNNFSSRLKRLHTLPEENELNKFMEISLETGDERTRPCKKYLRGTVVQLMRETRPCLQLTN